MLYSTMKLTFTTAGLVLAITSGRGKGGKGLGEDAAADAKWYKEHVFDTLDEEQRKEILSPIATNGDGSPTTIGDGNIEKVEDIAKEWMEKNPFAIRDVIYAWKQNHLHPDEVFPAINPKKDDNDSMMHCSAFCAPPDQPPNTICRPAPSQEDKAFVNEKIEEHALKTLVVINTILQKYPKHTNFTQAILPNIHSVQHGSDEIHHADDVRTTGTGTTQPQCILI